LSAGVTAEYLENSKSGMAESQMNISQVKLKEAPIAICPVAEQKKIVDHVEKLIVSCDLLKERLINLDSMRVVLAEAAVNKS
jgi:type I restriction enzyme S subunit